MGMMTQLLTEVCERLPTGDIDGSSPCAGHEHRRRRSVSSSCDEFSEHENEPRRKSRREDDSRSGMAQVMMLHNYWPNHRFARQPPTNRMLWTRTSCLRNSKPLCKTKIRKDQRCNNNLRISLSSDWAISYNQTKSVAFGANTENCEVDMTKATKVVEKTNVVKVVDMTKVFFGERIPLKWAEKIVHRSEERD